MTNTKISGCILSPRLCPWQSRQESCLGIFSSCWRESGNCLYCAVCYEITSAEIKKIFQGWRIFSFFLCSYHFINSELEYISSCFEITLSCWRHQVHRAPGLYCECRKDTTPTVIFQENISSIHRVLPYPFDSE